MPLISYNVIFKARPSPTPKTKRMGAELRMRVKVPKRRSRGTARQPKKINKTNTKRTVAGSPHWQPMKTRDYRTRQQQLRQQAPDSFVSQPQPQLCPHPCVVCYRLSTPRGTMWLHFFSSVQVKFSIWGRRSVTQWNFRLVSSRLAASSKNASISPSPPFR